LSFLNQCTDSWSFAT